MERRTEQHVWGKERAYRPSSVHVDAGLAGLAHADGATTARGSLVGTREAGSGERWCTFLMVDLFDKIV